MKTLTIDQLREQRQTAQQEAADAREAAAAAALAGDLQKVAKQRAAAAQAEGIVESLDEAISQAESNAADQQFDQRQRDVTAARAQLVAKAATVNKLAERAAAIADELVEALRELEAAGSAVSGLTYEVIKLAPSNAPYRGFAAIDGSTRQLSLATVQNVLAALEMKPEQLGWGRADVESVRSVMAQRVQAVLADVDQHVGIALGLIEAPAKVEGLPGQAPVIRRGSDAVVGSNATATATQE